MAARAVIEPCAWGGWEHNLRLANAEVEVVVTLDVGPRIIRYGAPGGANALKEVPEHLGRSGEPGWIMRGGHRFWVSPEDPARTYLPDNGPVSYKVEGDRVRVSNPPDARFGLEKTMELELAPTGTQLKITHKLRNAGKEPTTMAPWALTVMPPGGCAVFPLAPYRPHPGDHATSPADFAPAQTMALWSYFRFSDPRVRLGHDFLRLRHGTGLGPTKLGLAVRAGWAAYHRADTLFLKRFPWQDGANYPDSGCNFESYTDDGILELESLGPLARVPPGGEISHTETWFLLFSHTLPIPDPASEDVADSALSAFFSHFLARSPADIE